MFPIERFTDVIDALGPAPSLEVKDAMRALLSAYCVARNRTSDRLTVPPKNLADEATFHALIHRMK